MTTLSRCRIRLRMRVRIRPGVLAAACRVLPPPRRLLTTPAPQPTASAVRACLFIHSVPSVLAPLVRVCAAG
jgi:hypothetical protein